MHVRVIAVGTRMPAWVDAAFEDYRKRLTGPWRVSLDELPAARRGSGRDAATRAVAAEAEAILARLGPGECLVCLDERGTEYSTAQLAQWLERRQHNGADLAFVIGGADGLATALLERAQLRWSLSRLTLPHALARVVLIEQLYRAASLLAGHPYHRP